MKTMKRKCVVLFLMILAVPCTAGKRSIETSFAWGAEWSIAASFLEWQHRVFIIQEGNRVTEKSSSVRYHTNAEVLAFAGADFGRHLTVAFCSGYGGASENLKYVPFTIRGTWRFGNRNRRQMPFVFLDCGTGVTIQDRPSACFCSRAGFGWGIAMSDKARLNFSASFRSIYCHPEFCDGAGREPVEIRRNNYWRGGLTLGMGLSF